MKWTEQAINCLTHVAVILPMMRMMMKMERDGEEDEKKKKERRWPRRIYNYILVKYNYGYLYWPLATKTKVFCKILLKHIFE